MNKKLGKLFLVAAPSGAGKTTLVQEVIARLSSHYSLFKVITYTTKQPRTGERQGIEYHFLSDAEFKKKIDEGFFVEYSTAYTAYYGFPKEIFNFLKEGTNYIGIVDMAGARAIKKFSPDTVLIGIKPPHTAALAQRLTSRAEDDSAQIAFRLSLAQDELASLEEGLFNYIIINDHLDVATDELEQIIRREFGSSPRDV